MSLPSHPPPTAWSPFPASLSRARSLHSAAPPGLHRWMLSAPSCRARRRCRPGRAAGPFTLRGGSGPVWARQPAAFWCGPVSRAQKGESGGDCRAARTRACARTVGRFSPHARTSARTHAHPSVRKAAGPWLFGRALQGYTEGPWGGPRRRLPPAARRRRPAGHDGPRALQVGRPAGLQPLVCGAFGIAAPNKTLHAATWQGPAR